MSLSAASPAPAPGPETGRPATLPPRVRAGHAFAGGVLMGLANLVPGVSGGTMILALGLYDAFIDAVARLTSLRWTARTFWFLGFLGLGLFVAVVGGAGVAVGLIADHRWVMYSLFIGMTLGGVPELVRLSRPMRAPTWVACAVGIGVMAVLAFALSRTSIPETALTFAAVGALAASSMILPGVSGSYMLLIFGMYDVVVGSVSSSALREDPAGSARVVLPVMIGAAAGIGLLSNLLRYVLREYRSPSHGLLLGLLFGAVLGLWPFQEPVHPELANRAQRRAVEALLAGESAESVREELGVALTDEEARTLLERWAGASLGDLEARGEEMRAFRPAAAQVGGALALVALGFGLTQLLGAGGRRPRAAGGEVEAPAARPAGS